MYDIKDKYSIFDLLNDMQVEAHGKINVNFDFCGLEIKEVKIEAGILLDCESCELKNRDCLGTDIDTENCEGSGKLLFSLIDSDDNEHILGWLDEDPNIENLLIFK